MVKESCPLFAGTPAASSLESRLPQYLPSVLRASPSAHLAAESPPGPLLSESVRCSCTWSNAFSLVTLESFFTLCHYPSMQQLHTSPTSGKPSSTVTWAYVATLKWAILGLCQGLMLWPHDTDCDFPTSGFQCIDSNHYPSGGRT